MLGQRDPVQDRSFALMRNQKGHLGLLALHRPRFGAIYADWLNPRIQARISSGPRQPLARAVGLRNHQPLRVLDATGGLGRDAYTLAALGAHVTLFERHHLIFQLLKDAHLNASVIQSSDGPVSRIQIIHGDAKERLPVIGKSFDVIFLDPMYPDHVKSALPSKEMQILRELTGGDNDAPHLLAAALNTGKRVVVKRGRQSAWLGLSQPSIEVRGTQVRFDIYCANGS